MESNKKEFQGVPGDYTGRAPTGSAIAPVPPSSGTSPSDPSREMRIWFVTGTFHGSVVHARTEGIARRAFHTAYNGESIVHITTKHYWP